MNTAIYSPLAAQGLAGNIGIGFAIPVDTVRRVVNQLITHGRVVRPTLGVDVAEDAITRRVAHSLRRSLDGALIVEVLVGGPAEAAGLRPTQVHPNPNPNPNPLTFHPHHSTSSLTPALTPRSAAARGSSCWATSSCRSTARLCGR